MAWGNDCVDVDHNKVRLVCGEDEDSYRYIDVNKNPFRDDFDANPEYDRILAAKDQDGADFAIDSNAVSATSMNPNLGASWWGGENGCSDLNMVYVSPGSGCGGGLEVDSCFGQLPGQSRHFYVYAKITNDDPVANDDAETVDEGGAVVIDLIANDTDDGVIDGSIVEIGTDPDHGSLVDNDDGTVTYTHDGSETVGDSFTYRVQDAESAWSNYATVTITVTPANDAPTISDVANQSTDEDTAKPIAFTITDIDSTLNCSSSMSKVSSNPTVVPAANIVFSGTAPDCTVTITPAANQNGSSNITLTVNRAEVQPGVCHPRWLQRDDFDTFGERSRSSFLAHQGFWRQLGNDRVLVDRQQHQLGRQWRFGRWKLELPELLRQLLLQ